jgi:transposase
MTPPPDQTDKDARIETLTASNDLLIARISELEAKLDQPPKTPDNSSMPPSKGQKASESSKPKPHAGSHRALHPHPTRRHPVFACRCQGCGAYVRGVLQSPSETYERIEIPKIEPDATQVSLYGGVCPGCARRFKAEPPPRDQRRRAGQHFAGQEQAVRQTDEPAEATAALGNGAGFGRDRNPRR